MIIGSTAVKNWYHDFREPNDLDLISKEEKMSRTVQHYWIPEFEELISESKNKEFLDPDLMLTLKASHANWPIHWQKTMFDISFLKSKGHKINKPIYEKLVKGWRKVHGKESAPLKGKTTDEFFNDAVKRKYNHDDLHRWVAYYDAPIYERIQPNPETVECAEDLFNKLSYEDQIKMAKEEIFVTALERYIIPELPYSAGRAYVASLQKFVTTMSKNWMSYFLIDNFDNLKYDKSDDYVGRFSANKVDL